MSAPTKAPTTPATLLGRLEPVRRALLADAAARADQIVAEAAQAAETLVTQVEGEAQAEVDKAKRRSQLSAQAGAEQVRARARSDGRAIVLRAQESVHHQLVDSVHAEARRLKNDPRYPALLDHLEALARTQIGNDASIERDPDPDGGVIAIAGGRRVDYTLSAIADRALDTLADEVAQLWM